MDPGPIGADGTLDLAVTVEHAAWSDALPAIEALAARAAEATAQAARADAGGAPAPAAAAALEMAIVFADDARLHALNWQYRGKDAPTNVLAFENRDPPPPGAPWQLGDVVVAFETARAEAEAAGIPLADHATHLVVHGVLHLFGYDHEDDGGAERMEALERRVLAAFGIADPYMAGGFPGRAKER